MGMSSSQARLLSLTARMSDLEYSAQSIANSKLRLAADSDEVSRKYLTALDKKVLTVQNGNGNYMDANAYNLTNYGAVPGNNKQRFLKSAGGEVLVSQKIKDTFDNSQTAPQDVAWLGNQGSASEIQSQYQTLNEYLDVRLGYHDQSSVPEGQTYDSKQLTLYTNMYTGKEAFMQANGYTSNSVDDGSLTGFKYDADAVNYYSKMFDEMAENGSKALSDDKMKDSDWLYNQLTNGTIFLAEYGDEKGILGSGDVVDISWNSGDPSLAEDNCDETDLAKAEAEYERESRQIATKDKKFDMELKTIETEHTAIQTEMDSVQKVLNKNIERTFKLFDA